MASMKTIVNQVIIAGELIDFVNVKSGVSKNGNEYLKVVKEEKTEQRQKDMPSRLNARRKMMTKLNKVKDTDVIGKLFNEVAPKYEGRVGGYTRIVKAGPRKGDAAEVAILQLV